MYVFNTKWYLSSINVKHPRISKKIHVQFYSRFPLTLILFIIINFSNDLTLSGGEPLIIIAFPSEPDDFGMSRPYISFSSLVQKSNYFLRVYTLQNGRCRINSIFNKVYLVCVSVQSLECRMETVRLSWISSRFTTGKLMVVQKIWVSCE